MVSRTLAPIGALRFSIDLRGGGLAWCAVIIVDGTDAFATRYQPSAVDAVTDAHDVAVRMLDACRTPGDALDWCAREADARA